jgi:hypothetical protein
MHFFGAHFIAKLKPPALQKFDRETFEGPARFLLHHPPLSSVPKHARRFGNSGLSRPFSIGYLSSAGAFGNEQRKRIHDYILGHCVASFFRAECVPYR